MAFFYEKHHSTCFNNIVLTLSGLNVRFPGLKKPLHVVRDLDMQLKQGSRTAILGESGCGKSVMAMAIFRLLPKNALVSGRVLLNSHIDLTRINSRAIRKLRGDVMVLAPQNPMGYLNPVFSVGFHLKETLCRTRHLPKSKIRENALDLLADVGFTAPEKVISLYPHQLSGGMAQRVILALGLTGNPALVIADEPTRGLDSTARDRYLMLTRKVYAGAAFLMITHDIDAAAACDRIMVMYSGRIVEAGPAEQILSTPLHPYTQGLMASHPDNGMKAIPGMPPNLDTPVSGCEFYPRCRLKTKDCDRRLPEPRNNGERHIRCFHA